MPAYFDMTMVFERRNLYPDLVKDLYNYLDNTEFHFAGAAFEDADR